MAMFNETAYLNDGLGLTEAKKAKKAEKWLSSGEPLTAKKEKKLVKWGLAPATSTPIVRPAPTTGVPTINLPSGGQAAPPLEAPQDSGGGFDLGGMFDSLPSWAIWGGAAVLAIMLLKKR